MMRFRCIIISPLTSRRKTGPFVLAPNASGGQLGRLKKRQFYMFMVELRHTCGSFVSLLFMFLVQ